MKINIFEDQTKYTADQGYAIGLVFFLDLWDLLEPEVEKLPGDNTLILHELFFREVCLGFEASAEWIESVFRVTRASRKQQHELLMSEADLFACALEFCKMHNERWEHILNYTVLKLESMRDHPVRYLVEWEIWKKVKSDILSKKTTFYAIKWSARLPKGRA